MYKCKSCGNEENFIAYATLEPEAVVDSNGEWIDWHNSWSVFENPSLDEPHLCYKCLSEDIEKVNKED